MIRRILLLLILAYSVLWFGSSYTAKNHVQRFLSASNSDNISIQYKSLNVAGYPFRLSVVLKSIGSNGSSSVTTPKLEINFNWLLSKFNINLGRELLLTSSKDDNDERYALKATKDITSDITLHRGLLNSIIEGGTSSNIAGNIQDIQLASPFFRINKNGKMLVQLKDLNLSLTQESSADNNINNKKCQLSCEITTSSKHKLTNKNQLTIDFEYLKEYTAERAEHEYSHSIKFNHLEVDNYSSKLASTGQINFHDTKLANGLFNFEIANIIELETALKDGGFNDFLLAFEAVLDE